MEYCSDFSHYTADNILHSPSNTAHSGPELCYAMPRSKQADVLASEVVLDRVSVVSVDRPNWTSAKGSSTGLQLNLD